MDLDKSGINFKAFIKGRGAEIFSLISCNPHPVRALWGIPRHLVQILAIGNLIANGAEKIHKLLGWRKCGVLLLSGHKVAKDFLMLICNSVKHSSAVEN
jgi:hypothetical protein